MYTRIRSHSHVFLTKEKKNKVSHTGDRRNGGNNRYVSHEYYCNIMEESSTIENENIISTFY